MKPTEAAALLTIAAAYDNRKPDADQAKAWAMALDGLRFEDCRQVVVEHYRSSREWMMPVDVVNGVKRIRTQRIREFGSLPEPTHLDRDAPDFNEQYQRYVAEATRAIGDGTFQRPPDVRPSELTSHDVIRELGRVGESVNAALGVRSVREAHEEARRRQQEADAAAKRAEGERRAERERVRREAVRERAKAQHPDHLPTPDPRPEHESNEEK